MLLTTAVSLATSDFLPQAQERRTSLDAFIGESGVTFAGVKLLHRPEPGDTSYVTFHKFTDERRGPNDTGFRNVCSLDVRALDSLLPFAQAHLATNGYHSVNGFFRAGLEWETIKGKAVHHRSFAPGLLPTYRAAAGARYLNACYVDVDCHGLGKTPGDVLGAAFDLQLAGKIPNVSVFWYSGRGLWLLWLLKAEGAVESDNPWELPPSQRAWPEMLNLYRHTERAIVGMPELVALGSDTKATDAARITRLAGSLNPKAGVPVRVLPQLVDGRIPCYGLRDVAAFWGVQIDSAITRALARSTPLSVPVLARPTRRPAGVEPVGPIEPGEPSRVTPKHPLRANGARERWRVSLGDFETLRQLRGGHFASGMRQTACLCLALLLRRNGIGPLVMADRVLAEAAASGLDAAEARHAIACSGHYGTSNPSGRWFAHQLGVTAAEAAQLVSWPAVGEQPNAPAVMVRDTKARRAEMARYLGTLNGQVPTVRDMAAHLSAAGFPASIAAIGYDYQRFGLNSHHPGGRASQLPFEPA